MKDSDDESDTDTNNKPAPKLPLSSALPRLTDKKIKPKRIPLQTAAHIIDVDAPPLRKSYLPRRRISVARDQASPKRKVESKAFSKLLTPGKTPLANKSHNIVASPLQLAQNTPPKPKGKGKGLAPSPFQRSEPQQVDIIVVDDDGEELSIQKKAVKPNPKPRTAVTRRRIILSSDEDSEQDTPKAPLRQLPIFTRPVPKSNRPPRVYPVPDSDDSGDDRPALEIIHPPRPPPRKENLPPVKPKLETQPPKKKEKYDTQEKDMPWNRPHKPETSHIPAKPPQTPPKPVQIARAPKKSQSLDPSDHLWASWDNLPRHILDSIQQTGDLQLALHHLSPRSRKALQGILDVSDITAPPLDRRGPDPRRFETPPPSDELASALAELSLTQTPSTIPDYLSCPSSPELPPPTLIHKSTPALRRLLEMSSQLEPHDFSSFVATFPFDQLHGSRAGEVSFKKVGEASFSEVFAIGDVVLKVVPIFVSKDETMPEGVEEAMWPSVSAVEDVLMEIDITRAIGNVHPGFIKLITLVSFFDKELPYVNAFS